MSATAIVILVLVILVVAALAASLFMAQRRRRLRDRFGPEYDRAVSEHESRREAEAELTQRERRVRELDIRPLSEPARAGYAQQWTQLQERFVDAPVDVVAASQALVTQVITERGYPADDHDQVLADLSVDHAGTLERYRAAEQVSTTAAAGRASTEDLRQAMVHYRALFRELLGEPAEADTAADETAAAESAANQPAVGEPGLEAADLEAADLGDDLDAGDDGAVRVAPRRSSQSSRENAEEWMR